MWKQDTDQSLTYAAGNGTRIFDEKIVDLDLGQVSQLTLKALHEKKKSGKKRKKMPFIMILPPPINNTASYIRRS